ncbi:MAG: hypothetical protein KDB90_15070 [Planctomycetes bacterium]|nr:hypothetical protein [Planctomycetota bacterium]
MAFRFLPLVCLLLLGFAPDDERPALPVTDTTDATIKAYTEGESRAPYFVQLHDKPVAGQFWETGSDSYDIDSSTRWQVSKLDGRVAIVEQQLKVDAEMFKSDYVLAYRVNLDAEAGTPNVTKAWIGKPGEDPTEITVQEAPADIEQPKDKPAEDLDETIEDFAAIKLGGGTWAGKLYTRVYGKEISQVWIASEGWFGGIIKVTAGDYTNQLRAFGTDAEPILKLPADILKDSTPKEDPKDVPGDGEPAKDD